MLCRTATGRGYRDALLAVDGRTGKPLWRFQTNFAWRASPMSYMFDGKQYIAIASGVCCVRPSGQVSNSLGAVSRSPELRNQSNATVLYVFGQ